MVGSSTGSVATKKQCAQTETISTFGLSEHREVTFGLVKYSLPLDAASSRAWHFVSDPQFFRFCRAAQKEKSAVLRNSSAKYRHPASPDSEIYAQGTLLEELAVKFYDKLTSRGRATVDIEVSVTQNDTELFTGTFGWFVASKGP
jgi:hypothetical protein